MEELESIDRTILDYLEREWIRNAHRPTYEEIRHALKLSSKDFVFRHVRRLEELGYVRCDSKSRSIVILRNADSYTVTAGGYRIPVLGFITAGTPIPLPESNTKPIGFVDVTSTMVAGNPKGVFAVRVRGDSMIEDRIYDGNTIVLRRQDTADDGDTVAVRIHSDASTPVTTLKKFYRTTTQVKLQPRNASLQPKFYDPEQIEIQGKYLTAFDI